MENYSIEEMAKIVHADVLKWSDADKKEFFLCNWTDNVLISYHHCLGRQIRNYFKLWEREWTPKIVNGVDWAEDHPDAISMKVIEHVWKMGYSGTN